MDRHLLISADCHAGAPTSVYREYLDPKYREEFDQWITGFIRWAKGTLKEPTAPGRVKLKDDDKPINLLTVTPDREREYLDEMEKSQGHLGNWDPDIRARELDREGIAAEVIFPDGTQNNYPPFGVGLFTGTEKSPYPLRLAGCRAHNRWLAELCQKAPHRHAGVALIAMDNPDETVEEIRWARKNGLFGGVLLPPLNLNATGAESFWYHPRYEAVWNVCEELAMPLNTHIATTGIDYGGDCPLVVSYEKLFQTYRPFWMLLWGGVFKRHPKLKLCITEAGGMQIPGLNAYFDQYLSKSRHPDEVRRVTSMEPSEYWFRHCSIGASAHSSRAEIDNRYEIGVKNIMWGSDYPHAEGTWPQSFERTKELFTGIPDDEVRLMLGGNAAAVYGFDVGKLSAMAAKIGPKVSDFQEASFSAAARG